MWNNLELDQGFMKYVIATKKGEYDQTNPCVGQYITSMIYIIVIVLRTV